MKTREEMNELFADVPEALSNTLEILDKVEYYSIDHAPIMPTFAIPEDFGTEEGYRAKFTEKDLFDEFTQDEHGNVVLSEEDAKAKIKRLGGYDKLYRIKLEGDYLAKLAFDGAKRIYGEPLTEEVKERMNFELYIMKTMGFPGYFLIVQDFINAARKELGVSVGPGRGSAAGSAVAYCLGITKIDPIQYDLLFERFLNPDRISLPDIDVDFDDDGRGEVLRWVTNKYGQEKLLILLRMVLWRQRWLSRMSRVYKSYLCQNPIVCVNWFLTRFLTRNLICRMPLLMFPNCKQRKRHLILYCGIRSSMPKCLKATCVVQVYMLAVRLFAVMILLTGYLSALLMIRKRAKRCLLPSMKAR